MDEKSNTSKKCFLMFWPKKIDIVLSFDLAMPTVEIKCHVIVLNNKTSKFRNIFSDGGC